MRFKNWNRLLIIALIPILSSNQSSANQIEGSVTKHHIQIGGCLAESVKVTWIVSKQNNRPTVTTSFVWSGPVFCQLPSTTHVHLNVGGNYYIAAYPVTPPISGVPTYGKQKYPWDGFICHKYGWCLHKKRARKLWPNLDVYDFSVHW